MKKRTGARNSAMAELLSKSNETQIKDRSATEEKAVRRSPAISPDIKMQKPAAPERKMPVAPQVLQQKKIENSAPVRREGNASPVIREKNAARAVSAVVPERKVIRNAEEAAVVKPEAVKPSPVKKSVKKKKARKTAYDREEQFKAKVNGLVMRTINKLPRGTSIAAVIVLAVLGLGGMGTILAFSYPAEAVVIPEAYIGYVPENEEKLQTLDQFNLTDLDDIRHDGRHYVTISVFEGEEYVCSTGVTTVGELIQTMDVTVAEDYKLRNNESDMISSDSTVNIDKITYGTVTETEAVPYETKYVDVQNIPRGKTKVVKAGANGVKTATYTVTYVNGVETERVLTDERITTKPTAQVVNRGVGGTFTVGGKTYSYSYYIDVRTTVYTGGGTTASGLPATEAVIAVDPKVIPLGTKVYVADPFCPVGFRTAADTGGSIKGNIIDIYMDTDNPYLWKYGRRSARVYILD